MKYHQVFVPEKRNISHHSYICNLTKNMSHSFYISCFAKTMSNCFLLVGFWMLQWRSVHCSIFLQPEGKIFSVYSNALLQNTKEIKIVSLVGRKEKTEYYIIMSSSGHSMNSHSIITTLEELRICFLIQSRYICTMRYKEIRHKY